jgi:hypothetical protein
LPPATDSIESGIAPEPLLRIDHGFVRKLHNCARIRSPHFQPDREVGRRDVIGFHFLHFKKISITSRRPRSDVKLIAGPRLGPALPATLA